MKPAKNLTLGIVLVVLASFQFSCDSLAYESALYRVMRKLKFRATEIVASQPARLDRLDVQILTELRQELDKQEIEEVRQFVEDGGTLIAAGDHESLKSLMLDYGLETRKASNSLDISHRIPIEPIFPNRPVNEIYSSTDYAIHSLERDVAPLYGQGEDYSIVTFGDGEGRVFFSSCPDIFSRRGLRDIGNATLLYNLVTTFPRRARVGIAEHYYYAEGSASANPLMHLLFKTTGGLGVLYIGVIVFLFLILRGRRFGTPLAVNETHRRVSSEYVHAMTALYQKGDTRGAILKQLRDTFRSNLAARWNVNPNLETVNFAEEIARRKPIDTEEIVKLLTEMETRTDISEARLLSIAKRVEAYCERAKIGRASSMRR